MTKPKQAHMFPAGDDLPLFSGTPQTAKVNPFHPEEDNQMPLFDRGHPDWDELASRRDTIITPKRRRN